jgi:DNA polymerase-3 subunit alpha
MDFTHLHVHSDYSLLDGAATVEGLIARAKELGFSALALTDHGVMSGAVHFYQKAEKAGLEPIIGMETYVAPGRREDRVRDPVTAYHLTLLAKDMTGYRNLLELASRASLEGFYYHPRVDRPLLEKHREGLIVLSGCLQGEVNYNLRTKNRKRAFETADYLKGLYGDDFFLEVMRNDIPEQEECNRGLREISRELRIPLVATNDVHYLAPEDAIAQEVLLCLHTGKTLGDKDRMRMATQAFYMRSGEEMAHLFADMPEAVENTLLVASRIGLALEFGKFHLPRFTPPDGSTPDAYFRHLCEKGIRERYGEVSPEIRERLKTEMEVIEKMGFVSYFLIVWDFIRFAREHSIPVGPGRGSAAGSIVAYALGITDVDPLKHALLFERFLNSERMSMPDIDIDFCREGREAVIRYVHDKYGGSEHVSQIITFGTMAARAVLRDVGRVLGMPLAQVDLIAKKIPATPGTKLGESIQADPELKQMRDGDPEVKRLFDIALRLEGLKRHSSTHAAGVVIGDRPLTNYVPLQRQGDDVLTGYTMEDLEPIGLLKMDFLGLKTLTVIDKAVKYIRQTTGVTIDPRRDIPPGDTKTYGMLARGDALGVFQLESEGMRDLLSRMRPDCFEDLVAILALFRPGPLGSGMVDSFVNRKHGLEPVTYPHAVLEPILKDTYGTLVYQEQIMFIANRMSGFSMNAADNLRKAMGKKKPELMAKFEAKFLDGAVERSVPRETAKQIWEQMGHFAHYCFNKSHTTAYAIVTYETAWLKANHPVEFMAALLSCDMGDSDKVSRYVAECRKLGIRVRPPDVNVSEADFTVEEGQIRFGLGAVKGVGVGAIASIVAAREKSGDRFTSLFSFCERVDSHAVNRTALEALVKSGSFDSLGFGRARLLEGLDAALRAGSRAQRDRDAGQLGLFGGGEAAAPAAPDELPEVPDWPETQKLAFEKEVLGLYLTSHPLTAHEETIRAFSSCGTAGLKEMPDGRRILLGGMFAEVKEMYPKSGPNRERKMATVRIEDFEGSVSGVLFSDAFAKSAEHVKPDRIVFVEGTLDKSREEPSLKIDRVIPVERAFEQLAGSITIRLTAQESATILTALKELIEQHRGNCPVYVEVTPMPTLRTMWRLPATHAVLATQGFVRGVEALIGGGCVSFSATDRPSRNGHGLRAPGLD